MCVCVCVCYVCYLCVMCVLCVCLCALAGMHVSEETLVYIHVCVVPTVPVVSFHRVRTPENMLLTTLHACP